MVELKFDEYFNGAHIVVLEDTDINCIKSQLVCVLDLNFLVNVLSQCGMD